MFARIPDIIYQLKIYLSTIFFSMAMTIPWVYLEKYVFLVWESYVIVICAFLIDTGLGVYKHIRFKTFTLNGFLKWLDKMVVYCASLGLAYLFAQLGNANNFWSDITLGFGKTSVLVALAKSILDNGSEITHGKFPPKWVIDKLKTFNNNPEKKKEEDHDAIPGN